MVAVSPLAMLRSLALGQGGFAVPAVQVQQRVQVPARGPGGGPNMRGDVLPPAPAPPPATDADAAINGPPQPAAVPTPRPRPAGGGGSYALPAGNAGVGKLKDILTAAAMGTAAAPQGAGIISSAASGFAGARQYKQDQATKATTDARQAEQDALDAEYKRAQIANLTDKANENFRPITDPAERLKYGIPETDKGFYQVGPDNRLYGGTGAGSEAGQTERIVSSLRAENPDLSYAEALALAQSAPNKSGDLLRRESLAITAAKGDPEWEYGDQTAILQNWRTFYGLEGAPPVKPKKRGGGKGKKNRDKPAGEGVPVQDLAVQPRAVNPDTGEAMVWDGKAWVPE